jgi:hypothetical protein
MKLKEAASTIRDRPGNPEAEETTKVLPWALPLLQAAGGAPSL